MGNECAILSEDTLWGAKTTWKPAFPVIPDPRGTGSFPQNMEARPFSTNERNYRSVGEFLLDTADQCLTWSQYGCFLFDMLIDYALNYTFPWSVFPSVLVATTGSNLLLLLDLTNNPTGFSFNVSSLTVRAVRSDLTWTMRRYITFLMPLIRKSILMQAFSWMVSPWKFPLWIFWL